MIVACGVLTAADPPYAGKWKMNPAKSDFGSMTVTYEQQSGGEFKCTADGQSFTFKTDGKDVMTPWGITQAWKSVDANTWEMVEKTKGKVTANSTFTVSGDGASLTMISKRIKSDGGTTDETVTFQRVSGGPGLAGKWKTKNLNSSSPETLTLAPKGSDGLAIMLGNEGSVCNAKFDGKEYPATGPMWPAGWGCIVAKNGPNGVNLTWRRDGKDLYKTSLTASGDGKTLTESGSAAGVNEKFNVVYDKL
jgi:hypothetical protein